MEPFGEGLWICDGMPMESFGFAYPVRMVVFRLGDGLALWSPVQFTEERRAAVAALGDVTHILCPNSFHHVHAGDWHDAFPDAALWGAEGLAEKRRDLSFAGVLGVDPLPGADGDLDTVVFDMRFTKEVVLFHRRSHTVIVCDLLQQVPREMLSGLRLFIARLDLMVGDAPHVPRKFRLAMRKKSSVKEATRVMLAWPAERILMAHGTPVTANGAAVLASAFRWLRL